MDTIKIGRHYRVVNGTSGSQFRIGDIVVPYNNPYDNSFRCLRNGKIKAVSGDDYVNGKNLEYINIEGRTLRCIKEDEFPVGTLVTCTDDDGSSVCEFTPLDDDDSEWEYENNKCFELLEEPMTSAAEWVVVDENPQKLVPGKFYKVVAITNREGLAIGDIIIVDESSLQFSSRRPRTNVFEASGLEAALPGNGRYTAPESVVEVIKNPSPGKPLFKITRNTNAHCFAIGDIVSFAYADDFSDGWGSDAEMDLVSKSGAEPDSPSNGCWVKKSDCEELGPAAVPPAVTDIILGETYEIIESDCYSVHSIGDIVVPYKYDPSDDSYRCRSLDGKEVDHANWISSECLKPVSKPEFSEADQELIGIEATLQERGERYGSFDEHARITQNIKEAMKDSKNWKSLSDDQKEALEMMAHKIGRILNGDPDYADSWHDLGGYSKLVEDKLSETIH